MRLASTTVLALAALYLVLTAGLAAWTDLELRSLTAATMERTAHLIGREVAVALTKLPVTDLLDERPVARRRLYQLLQQMTVASQVVRSVDVVSAGGEVLTSDELTRIGTDRPAPWQLFGTSREPVLEGVPGSLFGGGEYQLYVPLEEGGGVAGYLAVTLESAQVGELVDNARVRLVVVTVAGLVAVLGAAALLHIQIQRRGRALAGALRQALAGEELGPEPARARSTGARAIPPRDEFAHAFELAGRLGRELTQARMAGDEARRRLEELAPREGTASEALMTDLRLAAQLRGLAGVFMAAAHDLKAPLNALTLNVELMRRAVGREVEAAPEVRAKLERYLAVLEGEIGQIDRALTTVLVEALPGSAGEEAFDLRDLIVELGRLLAPQARRQGVELSTRLPERPVRIKGFRDRLKQALLNLAVNGLEAMPRGGTLSLCLAAEDGHARIIVGDTGPGIPAEIVPRIFDLHFTTKASGTGIGLHVARSVVTSAGGEIEVETAPQKGTSFVIQLPVAAEVEDTHAACLAG
jgi:signal transduction histidine kinase